MEELEYSVFLPRCENTFKWLDRHFDYHTDNDQFDYEFVFVTFDSSEDALTAMECLLAYGNSSVH